MTSKHLFLRFVRVSLRGWLGVLILSLYAAVVYAADFAMAQRGMVFTMGDSRIGPANEPAFWMTMILGILCAFKGFGFLFSEKKTDFYMGLPVKRSILFWNNYVCGIMAGILPCMIGRILCLLIKEHKDASTVPLFLAGLAVNLLGFLLFYHGTLVLIVITGKLLAAVAGLALVWTFGNLVIGYVAEKYSSVFFQTYYRSNILEELKVYLSPVEVYRRLAGVNEYLETEVWRFQEKAVYVWTAAALMLLLGLLAYILFQRRPAEGAGKVLVFHRSRGVFKIVLAVPFSLLAGYFLMQCAPDGKSVILLAAGILFGAFTCCGVIEAIYAADIRFFLAKKREMAAVCVLGILAAGIFYLDVFHYDAFVPEAGQVEAVAVSVRGVEDRAYWQKGSDKAIAADQLSAMRLTNGDKESALRWIRELANDGPDGALAGGSSATVAFYNKNGGCVYRRYQVSAKRLQEFAELYGTEEFKKGSQTLAACERAGRKKFVWTNGAETYRLDLDDEENAELLKCWQEENDKLQFADLESEPPCGMLALAAENGGNEFEGYLYPSFLRTLQFLEGQGVPAGKALSDYDITRIEIRWDQALDTDKRGTDVYDDASYIEKLKPYLIYEGCAVNAALYPMERCKITVKYKNEGSNTYGIAECRMKAGIIEETEE